MNTSNSKKTRLNKILYYSAHKRCTHFINTMQILPGDTHHFILQLYVYDFAVDKNWHR